MKRSETCLPTIRLQQTEIARDKLKGELRVRDGIANGNLDLGVSLHLVHPNIEIWILWVSLHLVLLWKKVTLFQINKKSDCNSFSAHGWVAWSSTI